MAVQQFCLRWNNHQPNFISVFTDLLNNETLVDVTLAAEGKQLQAHKVVLSACSTYFQTLFTNTPCQHPIVILKDIKYSDLKTMVDFMYYGEVNVSQDQLPAILKTAETLKVKGLAEMPEGVSLSKSDSQGSESPWSLRRKRLRKSSTGSSEQTSTEDGAAGGSVGSGGTLAAPSPLVKQETESDHHPPPPTRDPSTESDTARSHSFDTDEQPPNTPSRTLPEDQSESSNIKWSSSDDQKPVLSQQLPVIDTGSGVSMGSKRGRLLIRQHRIKKETETANTLEEESSAERSSVDSSAGERSSMPRIERHSSEPSPQQHHLTVPHYLPKQNSSPHLTVPTQPHIAQSGSSSGFGDYSQQHLPVPPQVHVTPPTPTSPPSSDQTRSRSFPEEHQRRHSSNSQGCGVIESCEGSRACHCPALRPGPALGCNFCWNTIDTHGRILRRKTKYHCPDCQTNLCIVPCFQEYHERQNNVGASSSSSGGGGLPPGSGSVGHGSQSSSHSHSTNYGPSSSHGSSSSHGQSSSSHSPSGSHGPSGSHNTASIQSTSSNTHGNTTNCHSTSCSHGPSSFCLCSPHKSNSIPPGGISGQAACTITNIHNSPSSKESSDAPPQPNAYPTIVKTFTITNDQKIYY